MKASIPAAITLLMLVGCSKGGPDQSSGSADSPALSTNEVASRVDSIKLAPGQWKTTQEIVDVQMTGLPSGVTPEASRRLIGQRTTATYCLTPEQAANPSAEFLSAQKDTQCSNSRMDMTRGKLSAQMQCAVPQQPDARMNTSITGTYLDDRYDLDMQVETSGLPNGVGITMKMKASGQHIGPCPAGSSPAGSSPTGSSAGTPGLADNAAH